MADLNVLVTELESLPNYFEASASLVRDISELRAATAMTIAAKIQNLTGLEMTEAAAMKSNKIIILISHKRASLHKHLQKDQVETEACIGYWSYSSSYCGSCNCSWCYIIFLQQ